MRESADAEKDTRMNLTSKVLVNKTLILREDKVFHVTKTPVFLPENSLDRGAWQAIVHGVPKGMTQLSDKHCHTSHTEDQRQIYVPVKLSTCLLNAGMLIELILLLFIRCYFF